MTQVVAYLQDICAVDQSQCFLLNAYKDYCFAQHQSVLNETDVPLDNFTLQWADQVADALGLPQADLQKLYKRTDPYDSDWTVREMWKYATSSGFYGTPTAIVNGAKLDTVPDSIEAWLDVLNAVYASQYHI